MGESIPVFRVAGAPRLGGRSVSQLSMVTVLMTETPVTESLGKVRIPSPRLGRHIRPWPHVQKVLEFDLPSSGSEACGGVVL